LGVLLNGGAIAGFLLSMLRLAPLPTLTSSSNVALIAPLRLARITPVAGHLFVDFVAESYHFFSNTNTAHLSALFCFIRTLISETIIIKSEKRKK
jgi:hypothetical protein